MLICPSGVTTIKTLRDSTTALINTVDAIAMVDANGVCVTANAALQALLRCSPTAIAATPLTSLVHEADRSRVVDALRSKTKTELDVRIVRTDGRIVNVCLSMVPRARGRGHFCFVRDRTRQKLEENKLISASAITAVGSLATGLAHEINNPLAAVLANVEEAVRVSADLEPTITPATKAEFADLRAMLDEALSASQRIQLIVRDLRVFACTEDRQSRVDLNATIEACCNIALAEIRHRARLLKDLTPVPPVLGNEAKLAQVVLNLLVNAAHAMPEGDVGRNQIRIATSLHGPTAVALEVSDTGGGITPASTAHVFDAFFTTKPRRPGMGLSICQAVVALHGGEISIHPGNEIGTVVRVILPALEAEVTKSPLGAPIDKEASKRRVLVVVDDPLIVPTLTHDLASNFEISSARTGREALDLVRAGGTFDAMLCDLTVPELSGIELHAILERDDPALAERTVFLTDPAFSGRAQTFLKATRQPHLEKPVGLTAVRELLTELSGPLRRQRVGHT